MMITDERSRHAEPDRSPSQQVLKWPVTFGSAEDFPPVDRPTYAGSSRAWRGAPFAALAGIGAAMTLPAQAIAQTGSATDQIRIVPGLRGRADFSADSSTVAALYGSLEGRMDWLQQRTELGLSALAGEIARLNSRLTELRPTDWDRQEQTALPPPLAQIEFELRAAEAARDEERVGDLLTMAADHELGSEAVITGAEKALVSADSYTRAAAARALAAVAPARVLTRLPEMIAREENPTARTMLEAALRSAQL